jgi:hypothetical protein
MDETSSSKYLRLGGVATIATAMAAVAIGAFAIGGTRNRTIGDRSHCYREGQVQIP